MSEEVREFRDPNGVRWQWWPRVGVKWWSVGVRAWVDSQHTLADLEADPEIREVNPVGGDL